MIEIYRHIVMRDVVITIYDAPSICAAYHAPMIMDARQWNEAHAEEREIRRCYAGIAIGLAEIFASWRPGEMRLFIYR